MQDSRKTLAIVRGLLIVGSIYSDGCLAVLRLQNRLREILSPRIRSLSENLLSWRGGSSSQPHRPEWSNLIIVSATPRIWQSRQRWSKSLPRGKEERGELTASMALDANLERRKNKITTCAYIPEIVSLRSLKRCYNLDNVSAEPEAGDWRSAQRQHLQSRVGRQV